MKRLTEINRYWEEDEFWYDAREPDVEDIDKIYNRLAAIEDILGDEYDLDRLRELAQTDKECISPCTFCRFNPPSSGDGKPCCMCPAVAALRREQDG
jgi:hypothetical protein